MIEVLIKSGLIEFLKRSNIENIICLPKTGYKIANDLKDSNCNKNIFEVKELNEAIKLAKLVTRKETICLFSPAASSYGYFKDFKERGNLFKELVKS